MKYNTFGIFINYVINLYINYTSFLRGGNKTNDSICGYFGEVRLI